MKELARVARSERRDDDIETSRRSRFWLTAKVIVRGSGREALRRGLPLYLTLMIAAFVVFAGNGLNATTLTSLMNKSAWLRAGAFAAWLIAAMPVARALLHDRQLLVLKTQPVPASEILVVLALLLAVAEAPWLVLWIRGATPADALAASLAAPALHLLWLARPWSAPRALLFFLAFALWLSALSRLAIPMLGTAFWVGLRGAWARGTDELPATKPWPMPGPSSVTLAIAHLATLVRAYPAVILRSAYLCLSGSFVSHFLIKNNALHSFSARAAQAEALFVPLVSIALGSLVGPLLRTERRAEWLLTSTNVSPAQQRLAAALTLAMLSSALGLSYCAVLSFSLHLGAIEAAQLAAEHALVGTSLAVAAESVARRALQGRGRDSMRLMLGTAGLAVAYLITLLVLERAFTLLVWALLAGGMVLGRALRAARPWSPDTETRGADMLEICNVQKTLGAKAVLRGVDLAVGEREIALIHGVNGAGKSTLLRIVAGLTVADAGTLRLGQAELAHNQVAYKAQLGYVPDSTDAFPDLLVGEYVALVQGLRRPSVATVELPQRWLTPLGVDRTWRQPIATLSFGQRKRLCLLTALIGDPWLLVLDEPSNGLDPAGVDLVLELISARAEQAKATLCCTNDAAFAARVRSTEYRLDDGRLRGARAPSPAAS